MYTLTEAAEATGRHKSTILRALQAEKIASTRDAHKNYQIAPDDLHKVYPKVEAPLRDESAPVADATERTSAPLQSHVTPLRSVAEPLRTVAQLDALDAKSKALEAMNEQRAGQVDDLRDTVADLQRRLDQAEQDRRQLETDRRQAEENSTRQVDQLSQLLAMEKKQVQQLQLEHQQTTAEQDSGRSWWPFR